MAVKRFTDSWKRIKRAKMHAEALACEWKRVGEPSGHTTTFEMEDERTFLIKLICPPEIVDNSLALELGEFFYQLRAALDAAMWDAVAHFCGPNPPPDANRIMFPIFIAPADFQKAAFHKTPLPQELKAWLETIQPYPTHKILSYPDSGLEGVLQTIHDCARKDRHRRLHFVASIPTEIEYSFDFVPLVQTAFVEPLPCNFLEGECYFLRVGIEPVSRPVKQQIKFATDITLEISCDEIPIVGKDGLAGELRRFIEATHYVVTRFEAAL